MSHRPQAPAATRVARSRTDDASRPCRSLTPRCRSWRRHRDAVSLGWSDEQIERAACATGRGNACGAAGSPRAGSWTPTSGGGPRCSPRWRARAPLVLSHAHAARAYGWPGPSAVGGHCRSRPTEPPARRRRDTWIVVCALEEADIVLMGTVGRDRARPHRRRLRSTAPAVRRAGDRGCGTAPGRRDATQLLAAVRTACGRPGIERARHVVALADGRRETPFESWSAWAFSMQGLPTARLAGDRPRRGGSLPRADRRLVEGGRGRARPTVAPSTGSPLSSGPARWTPKASPARSTTSAVASAGSGGRASSIVRWEPRDVLQPDRQRRLAHSPPGARRSRPAAAVHRQDLLAVRSAAVGQRRTRRPRWLGERSAARDGNGL